jgi:hypothetical protein
MYGFTDGDIVEKTELYTIWRVSEVVCIRVVGVVDDEKSERWRSGLTSYLERTGYPRFAALDSTGSDAQNSLRSRLSSATFGRNLARRLEWGAVLTGSGSGPLVVVRTVLRVGGDAQRLHLSKRPGVHGGDGCVPGGSSPAAVE